nr:MAG TPA: YopX protein [Caudoviricetes sp.]
MREILFKAKRKDNGEWVEGYYVYDNVKNKAFICATRLLYEWLPKVMWIEVDPNTICQFTGMTDKNGVRIWKNDIIKYHFGEIYAPIKYGYYQNCFDSQKTEHVGFYVDWTGDKCLRKDLGYWINMVDAIPVGNIFDNPELLQEEH